MSRVNGDSFSFIDQASGRRCVLRVGTQPLIAGVMHGDCPVLADVSPQMDAFYCSVCNYNGRIDGAWFMQRVETVSAGAPEDGER